MINTAETMDPRLMVSNTDPSETVPPTSVHSDSSFFLTPEDRVDGYTILSVLASSGKQAHVYLAEKWGQSYVLKMYHMGWEPDMHIQSFLKNVNHPSLAPILDTGMYAGRSYEVYEYYPEGTLEEEGSLDPEWIEKTLVPSLNEGLHCLHSEGIVHCDIKPSNLFYKDRKSRIVIGDCGIGVYKGDDANTPILTEMRGTPEYASPVKSFLGNSNMKPSYDYGSFGLVLCKAVLGRSLFSGMTENGISWSWEHGMNLPPEIRGRLGELIAGLLKVDEDERWGYNEVKRWINCIYVERTATKYGLKKGISVTPAKLCFAMNGDTAQIITSLRDLSFQMRGNWAMGIRVVQKEDFYIFLKKTDPSLAARFCEWKKRDRDVNHLAFRVLMEISDDPENISYMGKEYHSLDELVRIGAEGNDAGTEDFLTSGLLVDYLRFNQYDVTIIERIEELIRGGESAKSIYSMILGKKDIEVFGRRVENVDELAKVLVEREMSEIVDLIQDEKFKSWLRRKGYRDEVRKMEEIGK